MPAPERNAALERLNTLTGMVPHMPEVLFALFKAIEDDANEEEILRTFNRDPQCSVGAAELKEWAMAYADDMIAQQQAARQRALAKLNDEDRKALGV